MKTSLKTLLLAGLVVMIPAALHAATAQENWDAQCKKCHSADGSGSGPIGKKFHLKDYTKADVQAAMTDEEMTAAIKDGVKDESTGKARMPAYAEKLSDDDVAALVALIRGMAK